MHFPCLPGIRTFVCCALLFASTLLAVPIAFAQDAERDSVIRGQVLFSKRGCRNCHSIDPAAPSLGPALGQLEKKLSRQRAVESIVRPNKEIRKGFEAAVVVTKNGKTHTGRIVRHTDNEVELLALKDGQISAVILSNEDVDEIVTVQTSSMPTDLLKGLQLSAVNDLLNYLVTVGLIDPSSRMSDAELHQQLHSGNDHQHHAPISAEYEGPDTRQVFDTVDQHVMIDVVPKQMRYATELFDVKPGARVRLTLRNRDEMQHNLFVCSRGSSTWLDVAKSAWALGSEGPAKRYVPDSPSVLHHTRLVNPAESDSIDFIAPQEEGVYPYVCTLPGHAFLMRGEMHVLSETRGLSNVRWRYFEGEWDQLPDFERLAPVRTGELSDSRLPALKSVGGHAGDNFGIVFDGSLNVLLEGEYKFHLDTDDGSRLLIDGNVVVDHDGVHGDGTAKSGTVDLLPGMHSLQLQFFEKGGGEVLLAGWSGPGFSLLPLTSDSKTLNRFQDSGKFRLSTEERTQVVRVHMPDASSRSIAVGLIGGVNCCFDASTCHVRYGWLGEFLDVGPDRGYGRSRGGARAHILGTRFDVSDGEFPIRVGNVSAPPATFQGYTRELSGPVFHYRLGGITISQKIGATISGHGIQMRFRLEPAPEFDLTYTVSADHLVLKSSTGSWQDNVLTIPAADAEDFVIELEPKS